MGRAATADRRRNETAREELRQAFESLPRAGRMAAVTMAPAAVALDPETGLPAVGAKVSVPVWHATAVENFDAIRREGLEVRHGCVSFSLRLSYAARHALPWA